LASRYRSHAALLAVCAAGLAVATAASAAKRRRRDTLGAKANGANPEVALTTRGGDSDDADEYM